MQDQLERFLKESRNKSFSESNQLTLGEIIEKLTACGSYYGEDMDKKKTIRYDFGTAIPTSLDSWRGSYNELALGYCLTGYDHELNHSSDATVTELLDELEKAIGAEFGGWKGGLFTMGEETPVWVANSGNSGNTGIVDIVDNGYEVIIMTAYCKY